MTTPGVGPVVALTYRATVDVPARFRNSKAVGAVFGLTPSKHQSGEIDRMGGISKCGDAMMRTVLFEAAQSLLTRTIKWSWLKGLGHEDRQKTRNETRDRRRCTADGGRDAPYMG
jgi:transposase